MFRPIGARGLAVGFVELWSARDFRLHGERRTLRDVFHFRVSRDGKVTYVGGSPQARGLHPSASGTATARLEASTSLNRVTSSRPNVAQPCGVANLSPWHDARFQRGVCAGPRCRKVLA